ncbi:uncharacterized protein NDAI_0D01250 [Naumovozyma dairenensis CBS 421]|uniref:Uncharacterized protein n=1 Tax=Naumovozyma dairenensis (strain ATCC 10597 / BCRC 20456 / CBS 421 / NBRC 0211 / NRRL Y-12639) TaxID=1071378 RepID=G0W9H8_NAUDC|nr:hypothetical protein NDAI_0D01250 [Naumovozyma dairenensis CBS 421]CCD24439.1 hypothetical protein NDAI_0D01250 [Naumovozyma dairenensis CBS 421]
MKNLKGYNEANQSKIRKHIKNYSGLFITKPSYSKLSTVAKGSNFWELVCYKNMDFFKPSHERTESFSLSTPCCKLCQYKIGMTRGFATARLWTVNKLLRTNSEKKMLISKDSKSTILQTNPFLEKVVHHNIFSFECFTDTKTILLVLILLFSILYVLNLLVHIVHDLVDVTQKTLRWVFLIKFLCNDGFSGSRMSILCLAKNCVFGWLGI